MCIEIRDTSREFCYTNKESAFYYGETNTGNKNSWQGFNVYGHEFLDDYALILDGHLLDRKSVESTFMFPDYLIRNYPGGITEELHPVDSLAMFVLVITAPESVALGVIPYFTDAPSLRSFEIRGEDGTTLIANTRHLLRSVQEDYPVWLAIKGPGFTSHKNEVRNRSQCSPLVMQATRTRKHVLAFFVADNPGAAQEGLKTFFANPDSVFECRQNRMDGLLQRGRTFTSDARYALALQWAQISMDALMMNQTGHGIFAGLPWFNNYWGRDTFISLPGATLVTGRFGEAKEILLSFAEFQQRDSSSTDFGRIPNIVTTTEKAYNTADGTPRFVMMLKEYVIRSGDTSIIPGMYPVICRSVEGTMRYHMDSLGFLTHKDAETWMDAIGPDGPWSPRGNRANDVQSLWAQQLDAALWFASRMGDTASAHRWNTTLQLLKINFPKYFVIDGRVVDHLRSDGTADVQVRPNQIFCPPLLTEATRVSILHDVITKLTYVYGVASLAQNDENFHPYHQYPPFYPKDAAYHNGIVWTWLQGPVISELCRYDQQELAYRITTNSVHQILDRGGVGTQSELLDAIPRTGENEPRISGTISQAWNLAEFVRNFYQDYLGIYVNSLEHEIVLRPRLPRGMNFVRASTQFAGRPISIRINRKDILNEVTIESDGQHAGGLLHLDFLLSSRRSLLANIKFAPRSTTRIVISEEGKLVVNSIVMNSSQFQISSFEGVSASLTGMELLSPRLDPGLRALRGPDYHLLPHAVVKETCSRCVLLTAKEDPTGDDTGVGAAIGFTYPQNPAIMAGSFDVRHFEVRYDSSNVYFELKFRALSDPGWHPEYGFQLTFAAIAIDEDGIAGSGAVKIPANANYSLDPNRAFEKLILVGGGLRIQDQDGRILAEYRPTEGDASDPFGDASTGIVSFALPIRYLGQPNRKWKFTVLSGCQDDHGGGGVGEFRTVNNARGEWNGGGRTSASDSNVYDMLVAP